MNTGITHTPNSSKPPDVSGLESLIKQNMALLRANGEPPYIGESCADRSAWQPLGRAGFFVLESSPGTRNRRAWFSGLMQGALAETAFPHFARESGMLMFLSPGRPAPDRCAIPVELDEGDVVASLLPGNAWSTIRGLVNEPVYDVLRDEAIAVDFVDTHWRRPNQLTASIFSALRKAGSELHQEV